MVDMFISFISFFIQHNSNVNYVDYAILDVAFIVSGFNPIIIRWCVNSCLLWFLYYKHTYLKSVTLIATTIKHGIFH